MKIVDCRNRFAKRWIAIIVPLWTLAVVATMSAPAAAQLRGGNAAGRYVDISLAASVESVAPGEAFEVALHFKLADGWHIYWKNPGIGLPPKAKWTLPAGFEIGELEFPAPKRNIDATGLVTNLLGHEPVLLATVIPPASIDAGNVTLKADITYLVCNQNCLRGSASVEIAIPVAATGAPTKPANEDLFKKARNALPKTSSKYVTITPSISESKFAVGDTFDLTLSIKVKSGFKIQSHKPLAANLIATDVFLERPAGITLGDPVYDKPKIKRDPVLGEQSIYRGRFKVRIPATVDEEVDRATVRFAGVMRYQACNAAGSCFPPATLAFSYSPGIADASASAPSDGDKAASSASAPSEANEAVATATSALDGDDASAQPANSADNTEPAGDIKLGDPQDTVSSTSNSDDDGASVTDDTIAPVAAAPIAVADEDAGTRGGWFWRFLERLGLPGNMIRFIRFGMMLLACFIYGLVLNATPCVLPVLSIKVLGFVQQAHESRRRTLMLGLSFGLGVIIFFVVLGFIAAKGGNLLQSPIAVITLGAIVMALALSMLGVYTLQVPTAATKLDATIQKEGLVSSFAKGALAPVLGFACTGPALAFAFGWATQQPPATAMFAFLAAGVGMASPYMLLGANPNWLGFLPKPGNWMITFERIMGFLLLAMVILLIHPLVWHIGAEGLEWTLGFFVSIALACWMLGQISATMPAPTRWRYRGTAGAIVLLVGMIIYGGVYPLGEAIAEQKRLRTPIAMGDAKGDPTSNDYSHRIPWRPWSRQAVRDVVSSGRTVFLDVTAAYCTNCKYNKKVATNTPEAIAKMKELGVVPFQADFTDGDGKVFELLQRFGILGPPLNVIYPAGKPDEPILMSTMFSKKYLLSKLDEAGPSTGG
ncbi:MAG: hypothetical protein IID36_13565 [Planctomycetes bacterium]|nr:hypothetical protein [Planctomycetota bacterium]